MNVNDVHASTPVYVSRNCGTLWNSMHLDELTNTFLLTKTNTANKLE
jgi:hypothetical protein